MAVKDISKVLNDELCLDGRSLSTYRKRPTCSLPSHGFKEFAPVGNWLQQRRLETLRDTHHQVLSELRAAKRKHLVKGVLNREMGLVQVIAGQGPFWRFMGHSRDGKDYLEPVEAVYLVESSCMEVYDHGLPMSTERLYNWMLSRGRLEEYVTYCHLARLGYVVRRYTASSDVTHYERQIGLDQHPVRAKRKRMSVNVTDKKTRLHDHRDTVTVTGSSTSPGVTGSSTYPGVTGSSTSPGVTGISTCPGVTGSSTCPGVTGSSTCPGVTGSSTCPGVTGSSISQGVTGSATHVSPPVTMHQMVASDDCWQKVVGLLTGTYVDDVSQLYKHTMDNVTEFLRREHWSFRQGSAPPSPAHCSLGNHNNIQDTCLSRAYHLHTLDMGGSLKSAPNWREYKRLKDELIQSLDSPTEYLLDDEVTPLTTPGSHNTAGSIYERLAIIKSITCDEISLVDGEKPYNILFEIFTPAQKSTYRKSGASLPAYRVVVMPANSSPPDLSDILRMRREDVPLLWAIADDGEVQFYSFSQVEISSDTNVA